MASPGLESFCCMENLSWYARNEENQEYTLQTFGYNSICFISSLFSIIGAVFMIVPCKRCRGTTPADIGRRRLDPSIPPGYSKKIISWLAVADLLACMGILVRSIVGLTDPKLEKKVPNDGNVDFGHVFCAVSSGWIQYFYISTFLWTFCYAVDILCLIKNKRSSKILYHICGWVISGVICLAGLIPLYIPSLLECQYDLAHTLPHFLSYYVPLVFVMVINPTLYIYASTSVKSLVSSRAGRYTDSERLIVLRIREKFFLIMLVFYVCWLPNVINGILMIFKHHVSVNVFIGLWNSMAVLNPLQAVLNTLVYKGLQRRPCQQRQDRSKPLRVNNHPDPLANNEFLRSFNNDETSPLLQFRR